MERTKTFKAVLAAAAAAVALAACSGGSAAGDKAGADTAPVTLRIGTDDEPGRPGADQIEEFARQVDDLSEGRLQVEPVWKAAGEGVDDWDQAVARTVVSGDLDMGMIPARAWDTEGVTSLRALHAPFLVTSDQLMEQIVTSELADEMLGGLDTIGITGLALLPEGLRHLFLFGNPPSSPAAFDGKMIRAPRSETTYALLEALGATPDDVNDDDAFREGIRAGSIVGAESSFALAGTLPAATTAIGNVAFFPKVNSLVINTEALNDLTADQHRILRDAARATIDWAIGRTPSNVDLADEYCANGGRLIAGDDYMTQLQEAVRPVYDELEQDQATKAMIEQIEALKADVRASTAMPGSCGGSGIGSEATGSATDDESDAADSTFPEGIYRAEITAENLIDAGVDEPNAHGNAGIYTLEFQDGVFHEGDCQGTYTVDGDQVTIHLGPQCGSASGGVLFTAGWTMKGDQLQFIDVQSGEGFQLLIETTFGGKPFTKIG